MIKGSHRTAFNAVIFEKTVKIIEKQYILCYNETVNTMGKEAFVCLIQ